MKFPIIMPLIGLLGLLACQDKNNSTTDNTTARGSQYYADVATAAKQAKVDLLAILKSDTDIQLDIDAEALQRAQEEGPVDVLTVDFDRLLAGDSLNVLPTAADAGSSYVPFVADGKIIAAANIRKQDKGYSIGMLGHDKISKDLQQVREITGTTSGTRIYQIPNINAIVYEADLNGNLQYFTDYQGYFNLKEPTSWERIGPVIYKDAQAFQKEYGELIKKEKLVK